MYYYWFAMFNTSLYSSGVTAITDNRLCLISCICANLGLAFMAANVTFCGRAWSAVISTPPTVGLRG